MLYSIWDWILVLGLSTLFNTTPVFAPPTLAVLAYFHIQRDLPILATAVIGGVGATLGRVLLALISRRLGGRLIPARQREGIERATALISENKRFNLPVLALFAVGPVPKSSLFMAAGIARMNLLPGALIFGVSRTLIYAGTLMAAGTASSSLSDVIAAPVGGPLLIASQIATLIVTLLLFRLDWTRVLRRFQRPAPASSLAESV